MSTEYRNIYVYKVVIPDYNYGFVEVVVMAKNKKEAIKGAKKHFRKELSGRMKALMVSLSEATSTYEVVDGPPDHIKSGAW